MKLGFSYFKIELLGLVSLLLLMGVNTLSAQVLLDAATSGSTFTTCDTTFYDSGGPGGNMSGGGDYHVTFCPTDPADFINIRFEWDQSQNDMTNKRFEIFDGDDIGAPEIYDGADDGPNHRYKLNGSTFYAGMSGSGESNHCLTFSIENSIGAVGWGARIFCTDTNVSPNDEICDALPVTLGATLSGNNYFSSRTCVGGDAYAINGSAIYNYGSYAENTTGRQSISDVFYSFVAPNSGAVTVNIEMDPQHPNDDFIVVQKIFQLSNCSADCSSNTPGDFDSDFPWQSVNNAGTTRNYVYYAWTDFSVNGQITKSYTGLTPGQTYYIAVGGHYRSYNQHSIMLNGNVCGSPGVWTGDYTLEVTNNSPCEDQYGNTIIPSSNDDYCFPNSLGIECSETPGDNKCATINGCEEPDKQQFFLGTAGTSTNSRLSGTVYYEYIPAAAEIGQAHTIEVSGLDCYRQTNPTANVSSTDIKIYYALWSIPETGSACNDLIGNSSVVGQGLTSTVSTTSDQTITFTPAAGEKYILGISGYRSTPTATVYDCGFDIKIDVYENITVNGGLPAAYICDFPDGPTASLEFNMAGGRGTYDVYFETDGSAIGTWSGGAMEATTAMIDTVNGNGVFVIDGIADGEFWSVTFDDGLGCTYFESGTYNFNLWCNVCDGYTKLDIVLADTAACPGEEIFLKPVVDGEFPTPFYAGGSMDRPFSSVYSSGRVYSYNDSEQGLQVNEATIASGSAQFEELCFTAYSPYWNYLEITMDLAGCNKEVTIWQGSKAGGSDTALGGFYGRGYQTFCVTTGWTSDTYGQKLDTDFDSYGGYGELNSDWDGCIPDNNIIITSKNTTWAYPHLYAYKLSAKVFDYINAQSVSFKAGKALQWIPETPSNTPFTPSISDGSELSYTPFSDPDSLTATFLETVPGTYAYQLVGIDVTGCVVGHEANHGAAVTGQGRVEITVYNDPTIDNVAYDNELCFGGKTDLLATVTAGSNTLDPIFGLKWTITGTTGDAEGFLTGDNTNATTILTSGTGSINFNLTVTDARGCSDSYDGTVVINPDCPAEAGKY